MAGGPHENGLLLAHSDTIEEITMDASPRGNGEWACEGFVDHAEC